MAGPSPEGVRGWLGVLMPLLDKSTPVTLLFVMVMCIVMAWHLLGQLQHERARSDRLGQWLLEEKAAHLALALQCGRRDSPP